MYWPSGRSTLTCILRPSGLTQGQCTFSAALDDAKELAAAAGSIHAIALDAAGELATASVSADEDEDEELEEELDDTDDELGDFGNGSRGFSFADAYAFARAVRIA